MPLQATETTSDHMTPRETPAGFADTRLYNGEQRGTVPVRVEDCALPVVEPSVGAPPYVQGVQKLTKDQQRRLVVEGLALGCVANGVVAVTQNKLSVEFALSHAVHGWPEAGRFSSLRGHGADEFLLHGIYKSERRVRFLAAWECDEWLEPYLVGDWTPREVAHIHRDDGISLESWMRFAELFAEHFKQGELVLGEKPDLGPEGTPPWAH